MFGKIESKLTQNEIEIMTTARNDLITALTEHGKNPSDFDTYIAFIVEFARVVNLTRAVVAPHKIERSRAEHDSREYKKSLLSHFSYFSFFRDKAGERAQEETEIIEACQNMMMKDLPPGLPELLQNSKIISFVFGRGINKEGLEEDALGMITIQFSDRSKLLIPDLTPESLDQARVKFNEKMDELDTANSSANTLS